MDSTRTRSWPRSTEPSKRYGELALRVVVDTNIWVSAFIVPESPPGRVAEAVARERLTAVATWELAAEIERVLQKPNIRAYGVAESDIREILLLLAPLLPSVEVDVEIRDPSDVPVIAAALAGGADAIVTGDRDFPEDEAVLEWLRARGISVLTAVELLRQLG